LEFYAEATRFQAEGLDLGAFGYSLNNVKLVGFE